MPSAWIPYEHEPIHADKNATKSTKTIKTKKQNELPFINFSHPSQAKTFRKTIRSHVTGVQHKRKREALAVNGATDSTRWKQNLPYRKNAKDVQSEHFEAASVKRRQQDVVPETSSDSSSTCLSLSSSTNSSQNSPREMQRTSTPLSRLAMSKHNPFEPYEIASDWNDDISGLLNIYLGSACTFLRLNGFAQESRLLRADIVESDMYIDSFLFNALITLTTTRIGVTGAHMGSEQLITWLRNNFLIMLQTAISKGGEAPRTLAVGLALLIGWELEFGDADTCLLHSRALPTLLAADSDTSIPSVFSYPDRNERRVFRGGVRLTPGFEFYMTQNLLPPRLIFLVGSLNFFEPGAPGARRWMRELWASIGGCLPIESTAQSNFKQRELRSRVAQLVRQAGYMLGSLMRHTANEPAAAQPLTEGIAGLWTATLGNDWKSMIRTVYDEILLWCLCVYCTTAERRAKEHMGAIGMLLVNMEIRSLTLLDSLLARYACPPCIHKRVAQLWDDLKGPKLLT